MSSNPTLPEDVRPMTTLWRCPSCGDVMPAGFGEDDHVNCNWPEEFPLATTGQEDN